MFKKKSRCTFVIGQKVVCKDTKWVSGINCNKPVLGGVYTIRDIIPPEYGEEACLVFHEIFNESLCYDMSDCEPCFFHWHFASIQETNTDISVFEELLTPKPKEKVKEVRRKVKENV